MKRDPPIVHVVDDDVSFRTAVSRLLRAVGHTVETFSSAAAFLERHAPQGRGCVVLDLDMPELDGLELQEILARTNNPLPVIFLTGKGDIPSTVRAMRHGAEDFLTKGAKKREILDAVKRAIARDARQHEEVARLRALRARFDKLTPREREVLSEVVQGRPNKQIADRLGITERTVKLHRTSVTTKLRVQSVAELTRLVQEAGLFDDGSIAPDQRSSTRPSTLRVD